MGPHDVSLFFQRCRLYKEMRFPALNSAHLNGQRGSFERSTAIVMETAFIGKLKEKNRSSRGENLAQTTVWPRPAILFFFERQNTRKM